MENNIKRILFTRTIEDELNLNKKILIGTKMDVNSVILKRLNDLYPNSFIVLDMTKMDWMEVLTQELKSERQKLNGLSAIVSDNNLNVEYDEELIKLNELIPVGNNLIDVDLYNGGIDEAISNNIRYKELVNEFKSKVNYSKNNQRVLNIR